MVRLISVIKKSLRKRPLPVEEEQPLAPEALGAEPVPRPAASFDEPPHGESPYRHRAPSSGATPQEGRAQWERVHALQELYRNLFAVADFAIKGALYREKTFEVVTQVVDAFEKDPYNELMLMSYTFSRKNYLAAHIVNDVILTTAFARSLGYGRRDVVDLGVCAFTHDLGMMGFEGSVKKDQRLSPHEVEDIKRHPLIAAEMARPIFSEKISSVIMDIHERENGQGYPRGIPGKEIHVWAKIVGICDTFEALTHPRVFRAPYSPYEAMKIIVKKKDIFFDDAIVKRFIDFMSIYPVGMLVWLSTGEMAMVTGSNIGLPTRPVVRVLINQEREVEDQPRVIDLAQQNFVYITGVVEPEKEKEVHYFLKPRGQVELDEA